MSIARKLLVAVVLFLAAFLLAPASARPVGIAGPAGFTSAPECPWDEYLTNCDAWLQLYINTCVSDWGEGSTTFAAGCEEYGDCCASDCVGFYDEHGNMCMDAEGRIHPPRLI